MNFFADSNVAAIQEVADSALHFIRNQHPRWGLAIATEVFRLGHDAIEVMTLRWADKSTGAMNDLLFGYIGPALPFPCGRVVTNITEMSPPDLWAARYVAAFRADDEPMVRDLYDSCTPYQLTLGAESLLEVTAIWINLEENSHV